MIDKETLARYSAETEADLRSIGAGAGLTLEVQRERLERLQEVLTQLENYQGAWNEIARDPRDMSFDYVDEIAKQYRLDGQI